MPSSPAQLEILRTLSILHPSDVTCGKVRTGGPNDGGYVMANDFEGSTVCYSIGVGPQVIWDCEMADRGMEIFQYDHTVDATPATNSNFRFQKIGIGPDLSDPQLITLRKMLEDNDHLDKPNMLLKVDIEGAEWDVFDGMSSKILSQFDQIIIEYHGLQFLDRESFRSRAERVFRTIAHSHQCIHVHGNNYATFANVENISVPMVIEVTYARRGRFEFVESTDVFPTHLDDACKPDAPDLFLGTFKYKCQ